MVQVANYNVIALSLTKDISYNNGISFSTVAGAVLMSVSNLIRAIKTGFF